MRRFSGLFSFEGFIVSKSGDALDDPEHRDTADGIRGNAPGACGLRHPMRRMTCRASARTAKTDAMNKELSDLDADVEEEHATGIADCGRPTSLNAVAKPEPCSRPKVNATTHGNLSVKPALALPAVYDFSRREHNARRDGGFDGRTGHVHESECGPREGQTVRDGERRDRRDEAAPAF